MKINLREEATQELVERYTQYLEAMQATNAEINQTFVEVMESSKYNQLKLLISELLKQYDETITRDMETGIFGEWVNSDASARALCRYYHCGDDAEEVCKQMENSLFDQMHSILKIDTVEAAPVDAPVISDEGMTRLEDICAKAVKDLEDLTQRTVGQLDILAEENDFFGVLKPLVLGVGQTSISFFQSARQAFLKLHEAIKEADARDMQNSEQGAGAGAGGGAAAAGVAAGAAAGAAAGGAAGGNSAAGKKYSEEDLKLALELLERIVAAFGGSQVLLDAAQQAYPYVTRLQQAALASSSAVRVGGTAPAGRAGAAAASSTAAGTSPAARRASPAASAAADENSTAFFTPDREHHAANRGSAATPSAPGREQSSASAGAGSAAAPADPYGKYTVTDYTKRITAPVAEELYRYARTYEDQYETIKENGQTVEENTKKVGEFLSCGARVVGCLYAGVLKSVAKQVLGVDLTQQAMFNLLVMPMVSALAANKSDTGGEAAAEAMNAEDSQQALSQLTAYLQKAPGAAYKGIQTLLLNKKISKMMKDQQQISPKYKVLEVFLDDHRFLKKKKVFSVANTAELAYPRNIALSIDNSTNRLAFIASFFAMEKIATDNHCDKSQAGKAAIYAGMWMNLLRSAFCTFTAVPGEEANKITDQYFDLLAQRDGCLPATNYVLTENGIAAK